MGRKREVQMQVRVLPQGALPSNPKHPLANVTPESRRRRMLDILIRSLSKLRSTPPEKGLHPPVLSDTNAPPR